MQMVHKPQQQFLYRQDAQESRIMLRQIMYKLEIIFPTGIQWERSTLHDAGCNFERKECYGGYNPKGGFIYSILSLEAMRFGVDYDRHLTDSKLFSPLTQNGCLLCNE
ncbi:hypothetical protein C922_05677 [Plasmodium inui San Antonio 1]|uniref:Uncharacterized protein n=1 Tax=Plasmodium inui San Antonio 1 TaxID=1237626 RepID=W7A4B6_9APIC|nr:hypothetical protein C922_05677 [Plasmodium inui San Antonio 1]EUD63944.1 hypothetical protein C922_05677 [Plasmodium inui San Antonio 1]